MGLKAFVEGGVSSIVAGCVTHPLDLIKVRMQLQVQPSLAFAGQGSVAAKPSCGPISVGLKVVQTEGARALFSGVSAAMLRQTLYSTTRLGLYDLLKHHWQQHHPSPYPSSNNGGGAAAAALPLPTKVAAGLLAGGIGAIVGNPADVAMVRMQADGRLPAQQRRNYRGVGDALVRMVRQEGVKTLWTGSGPTVQRAMVVTAAQLATYDEMKEALISHRITEDGFATQVAASFGAAMVASVASNPIDVVKTRIMNMNMDGGGQAPYSGALDCAVKTVRAEGPMALYKGFVPTLTRQGPFAVVLFLTLENVRALLKDF